MAQNNEVSTKGVTKIDPATIPGFGPTKAPGSIDLKKHKVHYAKIDLDDPGSVGLLEQLETRAVRGDGVYILTKEHFTFMDKMFMVISYLEEVKGS